MNDYTEYVPDCIVYLSRLGITTDADDAFLRFCIERSIYRILNMTNISDKVPERLKYVLCTMACGYYLKDQYISGKLSTVFSFEKAVKQWTAGDTSYTYRDVVSPEENFQEMLEYMIDGRTKEIIKFRKIKW